MNKRRAIALFGGTFAPLHRAHIQLMRRALRDLPICAVHLIPNGKPPHRAAPKLSWRRRVRMCQQACDGDARLKIGLDESPPMSRPTVQTLARRRHKHRRQTIILILGADAFAGFHRWVRWRQILQTANIAVARRNDNPRAAAVVRARCHMVKHSHHLAAGVGRVLLWGFRPDDISATQIRRAAAGGQ